LYWDQCTGTYGTRGYGVRGRLAGCVNAGIRDAFPSPDGEYTGFQYERDDAPDFGSEPDSEGSEEVGIEETESENESDDENEGETESEE
jgi:hypothetical protein